MPNPNLTRTKKYHDLQDLEANQHVLNKETEPSENKDYLKLTVALVGSFAFGATAFAGFQTLNPVAIWTISTAAVASTSAGVFYGVKIVREKLEEIESRKLFEEAKRMPTETSALIVRPNQRMQNATVVANNTHNYGSLPTAEEVIPPTNSNPLNHSQPLSEDVNPTCQPCHSSTIPRSSNSWLR